MHLVMHHGGRGMLPPTRIRRRSTIEPDDREPLAMKHDFSAYGLWFLVIIDSGIFVFFALSFLKPWTKRDWRSSAHS